MAKPGYSSSGVLPVMVVAAQLLVIGWGVAMVADASPGMIAELIVAVGLGSGIFGLLTAHELIHCRSRALSALGMLTAVTYRHFRIAQLREHHRWAVTARDPGTARLGESAYAFLPRSIAAQLGIAHGGGGPGVPQRAPIAQPYLPCADLLIYTLVYASLAVAFGFQATLFQAGQSLVAITVLGLLDYVAHYGLARRQRPGGGGDEPMSDLHSRNAEGQLANLLILNMRRHSDHHRKPSEPYRRLVTISDTPLLSGGYAGAILTALVPPLWRRRMDKLAEHWAQRAQGAPPPDAGERSTRSPV